MLPTKLLLRLARRLASVRTKGRRRDAWAEQSALERLAESHQALQSCRRRLGLARERDLRRAAALLERELRERLQAVREAADRAQSTMERSQVPSPRLTDWLDELHQLESEFGAATVDWEGKTLAVTTAPITLRGVYLGPFSIRLHWEQPAERCFTVVALDPQPAAPNEDVTHPHVKDESLCAGDATVPLRLALEQGRVADAFCLVRSVLEHYNPGSPYVALEDWSGTECYDCGCLVPDDERTSCEGCDHDYCCDCTASCSCCDAYCCRGCLEGCAVCDASCCAGCLESSAHSGRACCPRCLMVCAACGAQVASDEVDEATSYCPACRPAAAPATALPDAPPEPDAPVPTTVAEESAHDRPENVPLPA